MKKNYHLLLVCIIICLFSCDRIAVPTVEIPNIKTDTIIHIQDWYAVGVFDASHLHWFDRLDHNYLGRFQHTDDKRIEDPIHLDSISNTLFKNGQVYNGLVSSKHKLIALGNIIGLHEAELDTFKTSAMYLSTNIKSSVEQEVFLLLNAEYRYRLTLNGEEITRSEIFESSYLNDYEDFVKVKLNKGVNHLVVKLLNGWGNFFLKVGLANISRAQKEYYYSFNHNIVRYPIDSENFEFHCDPFKLFGTQTEIHTLHTESELEDEDSLVLRLKSEQKASFLDRIYLNVGDWVLKQDVLIGKEDSIYEELVAQRGEKLKSASNERRLELISSYRRLEGLFNSSSRKSDSSNWAPRFVRICQKINASESSKINVKGGIHFRSYFSHIDSSYQQFVTFAPEQYNDSVSYPLVYIVRPVTTRNEFVNSAQFRYNDDILQAQALSERYGCVTAISSLRLFGGRLAPVSEDDFIQTLQSVKSIYNIDSNRVFLVGSCSGGWRALRFASMFPEHVAGLAMFSVDFETDENDVKNFDLVKNLENIPKYFQYDTFDTHIPTSKAMQFINMFRSKGMPIEISMDNYSSYEYYNELINEKAYQYFAKLPDKLNNSYRFKHATYLNRLARNGWLQYELDDIGKLANVKTEYIEGEGVIKISGSNISQLYVDLKKFPFKQRDDFVIIYNNNFIPYVHLNDGLSIHIKESVDFTKNAFIEGPIDHFYSKPFIISAGRTGSAKQNYQNGYMASLLRANWEHSYNVRPRIVSDFELNESMIENYNIVVVGDINSHIWLNKFYDSLPYRIFENRVEVSDQIVKGRNISLEFIYPNPLNSKKYWHIITTNNYDGFDLVHDWPWLSGTEDYIIQNKNWDDAVYVGNFNKTWQ